MHQIRFERDEWIGAVNYHAIVVLDTAPSTRYAHALATGDETRIAALLKTSKKLLY